MTAAELRAWRQRMGLTGDQAADLLGRSHSWLRHVETGPQDRQINRAVAKLAEMIERERSGSTDTA